jgi:uncharacterized repeat protein (TIGR03943 family)
MKRETQNTMLLLVGLSVALIVATGVFTRYVKPTLLPWLVLTAALLIGLALVAIVSDIRRGGVGRDTEDGHSHRVVWLLAVPVVVLIFVTPPALGPRAATGSVANVSNDAARQAFPPLPPGRAPEVSLPDVVMRAANDSAGSLTNRLITVTGFVVDEPGGIDLARIVIICCAADAQLARIHLRDHGGGAFGFTDNTWLRVEGVVTPAERQPHTPPIPTLRAVSVTPVAAPANPYA